MEKIDLKREKGCPEEGERNESGSGIDECDYHDELVRAGNDEDETLHRCSCTHFYRRVRDQECLQLLPYSTLHIEHDS